MSQKIDKQIEELNDQKSVVKFEFVNAEYVVLYKSGADFWNATMHSALFLKFWLKVGTRMNLTNDKYYKLEYRPYLAIHRNGLQGLLGNLTKAGCRKVRLSEEMIVFRTPRAFDQKQISEWNASTEVAGKKLNDYYLPGTGETEIYTLLRNLYSEMGVLSRKVNSVSRELYIRRAIDYIINMFELYNTISAEGVKGATPIKLKMAEMLDKMNFVLIVSIDDNVMSTRRALRIGELSLRLRRVLAK